MPVSACSIQPPATKRLFFRQLNSQKVMDGAALVSLFVKMLLLLIGERIIQICDVGSDQNHADASTR